MSPTAMGARTAVAIRAVAVARMARIRNFDGCRGSLRVMCSDANLLVRDDDLDPSRMGPT
ncbi:MAG: hypothetical protein CMJ52_06795 [Planctomycetaceae bacterium]|nr:hypothetical protein [Planctomycetaceae bacterium]